VWESDGGTRHALDTGYLNFFLLRLIPTTTTMNSLAQRFDANSPLSKIKRAQAIVEEDGDNVSDLMWGSYGGFGNLATGIPKFNIPAVPDVSLLHCTLEGVHGDLVADVLCCVAQRVLAIAH
jgi:hypothetical protein